MEKPVFGLIGTVSKDEIRHENGPSFLQLGGILYQAAVLCALGEETVLFANVPETFEAAIEEIVGPWPTLRRDGLRTVPGPGNRVHLFYPEHGERREVLESTVPALDSERVTRVLPRLSMLIMVVNSGFDIVLDDWRRIADAAACPVWFDVHSLTLARVLGKPRSYRPVPEWKEWAKRGSYLQANRQEIACMLGRPEMPVTPEDIDLVCREALDLGLKAVFVTLGKEGGLAVTRDRSERIGLTDSGRPLDTTGCGDVFCAAAASRLVHGADPFAAASFGINLASRAAFAAGIRETYDLARRLSSKPAA
jgi:sugar/nucleoside kinase (ribokinase family)